MLFRMRVKERARMDDALIEASSQERALAVAEAYCSQSAHRTLVRVDRAIAADESILPPTPGTAPIRGVNPLKT